MNTIYKTTFKPEEGKIVELPSEVGRVTTDRVGNPDYGTGTLYITVVGNSDKEKYVILKVHGDSTELENDSQILAVNSSKDCLWYGVPLSKYEGDE